MNSRTFIVSRARVPFSAGPGESPDLAAAGIHASQQTEVSTYRQNTFSIDSVGRRTMWERAVDTLAAGLSRESTRSRSILYQVQFMRFATVPDIAGLSRSTTSCLKRRGAFPPHRRISAKCGRVDRRGRCTLDQIEDR